MVRQSAEHGDPVAAAMDRVLKAERDGVLQVRQSHDKAEQLLSEARAGAAAIALRVDGCISKLHTAYLQKVQSDINALNGANAAHDAGHEYDMAALEAAARRVALKLTGEP